MVELDNVSLVRNEQTLLSNISLSVQEGDHFALVGPNGAGKSLLTRIISADLVPSSGVVHLFGKQFGKYPLWELRKKVGFVSSRMQYLFPSRLSCLEVICTGVDSLFDLRDPLPDDSLAEEMLERFNLKDVRERQFSVLSDGERRRTLLARALINSPELLVLDEPSQGLDLVAREKFKQELSTLAGLTMVMVSHQLEEFPPFFGKAGVLSAGKLAFSGKIEDVFTSKALSRAFGAGMVVEKSAQGYHMRLGS